MEVSKAEIDAVLDAQGRFVWTPNALTLDGQRNVPCDLQAGETLDAFLRRHVPGIDSGAWSVSIGGAMVPRAMWAKTFPKHGMLIACRATVGKQVVQLVAIAALSYFTLGAGAAAIFGTTLAGQALALGVFVAGSVLINKVLGPKVPKTAEAAAARNIYSLSGQRNSARQYEPVPVLWGEIRVTPDLASKSYAWFEGDNQYLSTILLGGINVHSASDLSIGETALSSYDEVEVYFNGFSGMANQNVPLHSNADTTAGGSLPDDDTWVTRTSSVGATQLAVDLEYQIYHQGNSGLLWAHSEITIQFRPVGTTAWQDFGAPRKIGSNNTEIRRVSWSMAVPEGQYDVRIKHKKLVRSDGDWGGTRNVTWTALRSVQQDKTDYSQFGRIGIKIKATGQISGSLDTLRATYRAKPMPIWNGVAWATATTRETGLSNPGAILLQTLRGVKDASGKLQFGFGLSDDQIDIEGLKAFMLHCTANGYTYDKWITSSISLQEFCQEVALAGMGEFSWTDGSRPTAVFVSSGQPISAVVNMANMLKASFSVDYALSNAADGIEYQYVDRDKGFETVTLRVAAPGVTTMLNPARVSGEGVTSEAHAAVMARYHLAQSLYQFKTIGYSADIEHLDYRRLSVVSVSHDLTQWGFGGRLMAAEVVGGKVRLTLDEPVPPLANAHLGLRVPGARDYRVWPVVLLAAESNVVELVGKWPAGVAFPGGTLDNPAHDTLWCYDFKATPGYRVRVTSMEPEGDLKGAKITCVPEGPEFWDYVLNGNYVPAPNHSALPQRARPTAKRLRVVEEVHLQGNTEWYELHLMWETSGEVDYCQVWAGLDGSELRLVDARATQNRASVRIDAGGQWLLRVVPFDAGGVAGTAANLLYGTEWVNRAPAGPRDFVVLPIEGGLRRYAWQWGETGKPAAVAGVQIRHLEGTSATVEDWEGMTPLGEASDIYTAHFESSKPDAGMYTFGLRSITTAGVLSSSMLAFTINLPDSLGEMAEIDYTPPPAPENLHAEGLFATVQVSWDAPVYPQGGGHKVTEVFAGLTESIGQAQKVADAFGGPVSFEAELGGTVYVWARFVTQADVPGPFAGPVSAQTAEDVEKLLDVLDGQITSSQLHQDLSAPIELLQAVPHLTMQELATADLGRIPVIDRIDKAGGPLGKSLLDAAASLESTQQQVRLDMNEMAQGLLEAALAADAALERITDAGVYVDSVSGQVKIYGLEATKEEVTNLEIMLDAVAGQLALKATTAYVDGKIAEAVLSPADLLLYEGLDARLVQVTQTLDSINGTLTQKANALELQDAVVRLTSAESTLDALSGQIALRVTRAEYEADQNALQSRLNSAEILLNAMDVPSITATVQAASGVIRDAEKHAQALLQDILTGERNRVQAQEALALARTELSASIQEGLQAEAQQRTQLVVEFGQSLAAVQQELTTLSAADVAEAQARLVLQAQLQQGLQALNAAVQAEQLARADADSAEALARQNLKAELEGVDNALLAAIEEEQIARVEADQAEASARQLLAARVEQVDTDLQASIESEQSARADAISAQASRTDALMAVSQKLSQADAERNAQTLLQNIISGEATRESTNTAIAVVRNEVTVKIEEGLSAEASQRETLAVAVDQQAALIEQESAVRAAADEAEAMQRTVMAAQIANEQQEIRAQIVSESQARADGDAAEASQRQQLAARVDGAEDDIDTAYALIEDEQLVRANADEALGSRITALQATVGDNTAAIRDEAQARADAISAEVSARQALAATVSGNHTAALNAAQAASDAAGGKGKVIFGSIAPATAERLPQNLWIDTTGGANTPKRWDGSSWAAVTDKAATDAAAAAATAQATANNAVAAIQTEQSVRANETGHLGAQYTVRMQLSQGGQQVIGGFGLSGTSSGTAGARIDFGVLANSFWVAAPNGSGVSNVRPFSVQTTAQTINGVVVPAGVYMDAAYINNVTVLFGRFGTLLADKIRATAISASQLTAGNGVIGGSLKSSNYVAGSSGWTLRPDGVAEFSGVTVRGTVYATSGAVGGITIASNELRSSNWNGVYGPTGTGWAIRANGEAYFNGLNIRGQINGGAYTGYGWPAAGQSGFHLGPSGLLIGNANNNKYFQVTADGDIYTPAFRVVGGVMTVQQANIIDTLQIKNGALTSVTPRSRGNFAFFVSASRTLDEFAVSPEYQNIIYLEWVNNIGGDGLYLTAYRGSGEDRQPVNVAYPGAYARVELLFYANGSYMGSAPVEVFQGVGNYVITPLYAVPLGATRVLVNMPPISRNSPESQRSLNNIKITTISIKR